MENLRDQLSNVSLYDVKHYVRKAQNAVLNFSDMEAKVREATNNEPWGTPTSVMQQIAEGTQSYEHFHEIMPFVYRRFTEKTAREWRQIYKSLTLLDYLVKNGSERVVDYARSHTAVIEMLKSFRYLDRYGEDKGAVIRRRATELLDLLSSVEKIRVERKKARAINLRTGVASSMGGFGSTSGIGSRSAARLGAPSGLGSRGGRFGGESISSASFNSPSWGGESQSGFYGDSIADQDDFEEYDAGVPTSASAQAHDDNAIIDFNDNQASGTTSQKKQEPSITTGGAVVDDDDDEFADFQSAPAPSSGAKQPTTSTASILDLFSAPATTTANSTNNTSGTASSVAPSAVPAAPTAAANPTPVSTTPSFSSPSTVPSTSVPTAGGKKKDDVFGSLWETSKSAGPPPAPKQASTSASNTSSNAPLSGSGSNSRTTAASGSAPNSQPPPAEVDDLLAF